MVLQPHFFLGGGLRCEPVSIGNNWNEDLPSKGMKAKVNGKCQASLLAWTAETRSTINPRRQLAISPSSTAQWGRG